LVPKTESVPETVQLVSEVDIKVEEPDEEEVRVEEKDSFEEHPLVVKGRYQCTQCERVFVILKCFQAHIAKPHTFPCKTCKRSYVSSRERLDHSCRHKCTIKVSNTFSFTIYKTGAQ